MGYGASFCQTVVLVDRTPQQGEQRGQTLIGGKVLNKDLLAVGVAQRHAPVRVLIRARARHVLRAHVAYRVYQGGNDELGGNLRDVAVQALDHVTLAGFRTVDTAILVQTRRDLIKLKAIRRTHGLDVVSQQTQFAAQRRLNPSNVAERRRQVVDIDRSQRAVAVVLRTQGPAATLLFFHTTEVPKTPRSRR